MRESICIRASRALLLIVFVMPLVGKSYTQQAGQLEGLALYDAIKMFELQGKASVSNLSFKRDRAEMTFAGDFYFAAPVNGRVMGAIFIGEGMFRADAPLSSMDSFGENQQ